MIFIYQEVKQWERKKRRRKGHTEERKLSWGWPGFPQKSKPFGMVSWRGNHSVVRDSRENTNPLKHCLVLSWCKWLQEMFYGDSLSHRCFGCECDSNSDSIRGSSCQQSQSRLLSETLEDFHLLVSEFTWSLEGEPCWVISHDSIMHVNIMWPMNSYLLLPPGEILPYKGSGAQFQELKWYKTNLIFPVETISVLSRHALWIRLVRPHLSCGGEECPWTDFGLWIKTQEMNKPLHVRWGVKCNVKW